MRRDTKIRKVFVPVLVINVCINQYCVILIVPPVFSIDVSIYIYKFTPKAGQYKIEISFYFSHFVKGILLSFHFLETFSRGAKVLLNC